MDFIKLTKKQTGYFFIIAYGLAFVVGLLFVLIFDAVIQSTLMKTFIANLLMTIVIYGFSLWTKNASMYDPYWSVIPPALLIFWIVYERVSLDITIFLLLVGIVLWATRLTLNWWKNWTGFKEQDWRYDLIKEKTKEYYLFSNFGAIHLIPTLVVYLQMINVYQVVVMGSSVNLWIVLGFILMLFGTSIQFVADKQMYEFRQSRPNKNMMIDRGIWLYSRHPNYLGELSLWLGVYLMYLGVTRTLDFNFVYPLAMIALFLFVSIPMMEKKLSDREGFIEYKDQVPALVPYPKRAVK